MNPRIVIVMLATLLGACSHQPVMTADLDVNAYAIVGFKEHQLVLRPDRTFVRFKSPEDRKPFVLATGRWTQPDPEFPIVELTPGGLFYIAYHDAALTASPVAPVKKIPQGDNPLLYISFPNNRYLFLPQLTCTPGGLDSPQAARKIGHEDLPKPEDPPLYSALRDTLFENLENYNQPHTPMLGNDTFVHNILLIPITRFPEPIEDLGTADPTEPKNFWASDVFIFRIGTPLPKDAQPDPSRLYLATQDRLFPIQFLHWQRPTPRTHDLDQFATRLRRTFQDSLHPRSRGFPNSHK